MNEAIPIHGIKRILFLRNDAFGDAVLASGMLECLYRHFNNAEIYIACKLPNAELYQCCPFVRGVIAYEHPRVIEDGDYLVGVINQIAGLKADLAINSAFSREGLGDHFINISNACYRIAHEGDLSNDTPELREKHNQTFTHLVPSSGPHRSELERNQDLLKALGIFSYRFETALWTSPHDEEFAERYFHEHQLMKETTIGFFPCSRWDIKEYQGFTDALHPIIQNRGLSVIALGAPHEEEKVSKIATSLPGKILNLAGRVTLRQSAALIRRMAITVGVDTALSHIACAVGTKNVVVLGGGHFGRFFPYSPLSSIVTKPIPCFQCNWECRFSEPHCIVDIPPSVVTQAINEAINSPVSIGTKIYGVAKDALSLGAAQGILRTFNRSTNAEIVPIIGSH